MWARRNEDQIQPSECNYNCIHSIEDISDESATSGEPVSLDEIKKYLRLEGFNGDSSSGLVMQETLSLSFTSGLTVTSALLDNDNAVITSLSREGITYSRVSSNPGNREFTYDNTTGIVAFAVASNGSETVDIQWGITGGAGTVDDFDYDDTLLESMLTEARQYVERITGIHLIQKHLQVVASNGAGLLELPGPVNSSLSVTDEFDADVAPDLKTIGTRFLKVKTPNLPMMTFTYWAGYNGDSPAWARNAIKAYVADHYEYRGDDAPPAANQRAAQICRPHGRLSQWG